MHSLHLLYALLALLALLTSRLDFLGGKVNVMSELALSSLNVA